MTLITIGNNYHHFVMQNNTTTKNLKTNNTMEVGTKVKIKETSIFVSLEDRHNPRETEGVIVEIGNESKDKRRTLELPIVVDWGGFTNSYRYLDLYELS